MNQERLMKIILSSHLSEKAHDIAEKHKQFTFKVLPDACKNEIQSAIEMLFKVKVKDVNVVNVKGKARKFNNIMGQRNNWKKAYVNLQEGYDINFAAIE